MKKFQNQLRFDKVTAMSLVVQFFWNTVYQFSADIRLNCGLTSEQQHES